MTERWLTTEAIDVQIPKFDLYDVSGSKATVLRLKLTKPLKDNSAAGLEVDLNNDAVAAKIAGTFDGKDLAGPQPFLKLEAQAKGKDWSANVDASAALQGEMARLESSMDLTMSESKIKAQPKMVLTLNQTEGLLKVETSVKGLPGPLVNLDNIQAELRQPFDKGYAWSARPAIFKIWGPVDLFFIDKDMRPPLEKSCRCKIPEKLVVTYEGRAWFEPMLSQPASPANVLESKLSVEGVDNKLLNLNLNAHLKVNKHRDQWIIEPRLDSVATVQSFQGLRQFLDARNVMIPAPLDVLDGKVILSAKGAVDHDDKIIRGATDVKADLSSPSQKVDVDFIFRFELARDFSALDVYVQTLIREFKIEMPPIDPVRGLPPLKADSRVLFKPEPKANPGKFKFRVFFDVKTAGAGSVKLLSKLASPYAPVTLDINTNSKGESAGFVRLEPFTIQYLRRLVSVERLQVNLSEDEAGVFPIGGRFRLDQTSYKIYVDLAGTAEAPIVNLSSEPYLERNDIISVLLFDRTSDQLVSADADTAGSVNAAMADRAIGLFGLWAFATTPIRSFSYNAITKVYTATVQLADGLTAGVGTNWERAAHLEVRKRVSRRWVLTASWSPTENKEQVGKLVLQWEKRF